MRRSRRPGLFRVAREVRTEDRRRLTVGHSPGLASVAKCGHPDPSPGAARTPTQAQPGEDDLAGTALSISPWNASCAWWSDDFSFVDARQSRRADAIRRLAARQLLALERADELGRRIEVLGAPNFGRLSEPVILVHRPEEVRASA